MYDLSLEIWNIWHPPSPLLALKKLFESSKAMCLFEAYISNKIWTPVSTWIHNDHMDPSSSPSEANSYCAARHWFNTTASNTVTFNKQPLIVLYTRRLLFINVRLKVLNRDDCTENGVTRKLCRSQLPVLLRSVPGVLSGSPHIKR